MATFSERNPNNLPVTLSSFIGREREILEIRRLLDSDRLLTLTGPGVYEDWNPQVACPKTEQPRMDHRGAHADGTDH